MSGVGGGAELCLDPLVRLRFLSSVPTFRPIDKTLIPMFRIRAASNVVPALMTSAAMFVASPGSAQDAETPGTAVWTLVEETMQGLRTMEGPLPSLDTPDDAVCEQLSAAAAEVELFRARSAAWRRDVGLGVEAGLRGDFGDDAVDQSVPGAYVGLSWEVLQSGLFDNRRTSELFQLRAETAALQAEVDDLRAENRCRSLAGEVSFAPLLTGLLARKVHAMALLSDAYRHAHLSGWATLEPVLAAEQEGARAASELDALDALGRFAVGTPEALGWFPPVIDVDIAELESRLVGSGPRGGLAELREREIRLQRETDSNTRLRLFMRYGIRSQTAGPDRRGFTGGLIFRMPLLQDPDAGVESEIEAMRRRTLSADDSRAVATRVAYARFRERLTASIRTHYAYLESHERVRRSVALWRATPERTALSLALDGLTDLHNAALARAASLSDLYAAAQDVFSASEVRFDSSLLLPLDLPDTRYRGGPGQRALYLWSDAFNQFANDYLIEVSRAKGFSRLTVSAGRGTNGDKLARLRESAAAAGIDVELLLSTNAWLSAEGRDGIASRVRELDLDNAGLHLDIEPHTLAEFDDDPEALLAAWVDVVTRVRGEVGPEVPLAVSVPVWWPLDIYERAAGLADRLYLMAYEESDPAAIVRRAQPIADMIPADRLVIALRASDFETEWDLDVAFGHAGATLGIEAGAVHDFSSFLALIGQIR